jgi:hypothetical protein
LDNAKISSYYVAVPRRKPGSLLPIESEILDVALDQMDAGQARFHGFGLAQHMRERNRSRSLTAHGTLYKALARLEELGLLSSRWEDASSIIEGRPRRRLYELTGRGLEVARAARAAEKGAIVPALAPEPA